MLKMTVRVVVAQWKRPRTLNEVPWSSALGQGTLSPLPSPSERTYMYICWSPGCFPSIQELLVQYHPSRNLRSQSKSLLVSPRINTQFYGARSFQSSAPELWNNIPEKIKTSKTIDQFKAALKTHYLWPCITKPTKSRMAQFCVMARNRWSWSAWVIFRFWYILKEQSFFYIILKFGSIKRIISRGFCRFSRTIFLRPDGSCDHNTCHIISL